MAKSRITSSRTKITRVRCEASGRKRGLSDTKAGVDFRDSSHPFDGVAVAKFYCTNSRTLVIAEKTSLVFRIVFHFE